MAGPGTVTGLGQASTNGSGVATAEVVGKLAGLVTIEARTATVSGKLTLTVVAGALDHITLTPSSASVSPGQAQAFVTRAYDAAGNLIGDVSATAILQISPDGICGTGSCTAFQRGILHGYGDLLGPRRHRDHARPPPLATRDTGGQCSCRSGRRSTVPLRSGRDLLELRDREPGRSKILLEVRGAPCGHLPRVRCGQ